MKFFARLLVVLTSACSPLYGDGPTTPSRETTSSSGSESSDTSSPAYQAGRREAELRAQLEASAQAREAAIAAARRLEAQLAAERRNPPAAPQAQAPVPVPAPVAVPVAVPAPVPVPAAGALGAVGEGHVEVGTVLRGEHGVDRRVRALELELAVPPDVHRHEVGRRGLRLLVHPRGGTPARPPGSQRSVPCGSSDPQRCLPLE